MVRINPLHWRKRGELPSLPATGTAFVPAYRTRSMAMFRTILPVTALALGLGTASASAQPAFSPPIAPENSAAARTLEQNRRVVIGRPLASEVRSMTAEPGSPPRDPKAGPAVAAGRLDLAAGGNPGVPR
jgi:hypothetical protein